MANNQWTDGYVSEINYVREFYREMSPSMMAYSLTLNGYAALDPAEPFTYCELGMGQGVTLSVLAATHPDSEFWGTDFNPAHTAGCRTLADAAGLTNLHVFEDSFAEFLERETPPFDVMALHGVWSWVSIANQQKIVEIVKRKLKPGGMLYISYNCLPGWAAGLPLRHLLASHVSSSNGPMRGRLEGAMEFAQGLVDVQAQYFNANPAVAEFLGEIRKESPNYLAHEYLNRDFHPRYFSEVAGDLSEAKLTFVSSATAVDQIDLVNFTAAGREKLGLVEDPLLRQTVRDYLLNTRFRRDIYVKGPRVLSVIERRERLRSQRFALKYPRDTVPDRANCAVGKFELNVSICGPILDALAREPSKLSDLLELASIRDMGLEAVLEAITVFIALGVVEPALSPAAAESARASSRSMNAAISAAGEGVEEICVFASPVLGSGIEAARIDRLFLSAHEAGADLKASAWSSLKRNGHRLIKEGSIVEGESESLKILDELAETFRAKTVTIWELLGLGKK